MLARRGVALAPFCRALRVWWNTQTLYGRQAGLEAAHGIRPGTSALRIAGRAFPSDPWCGILFSLIPQVL
jgi:hypothetical protein